ncbi:MAG: hypothetical protein FJ304_23290 [Planctomycetes bacterium]|nr:hypothetical protein [Planctomycetota bacterium]
MTITFPEGVAERIESIAKQKGYPSAAELLIDLVDEADARSGGPHKLTPRNRAELEAMLEAVVNSGPTVPDSPAFWDERERVLAEPMTKQNGGAA